MEFINSVANRGKKLGDKILDKDIDSVLSQHNQIQLKDTIERLESAFRSAVYRGTYDAFVLEKECEDKLRN